MKYLIRFEDTYGMADLFSAVIHMPYHDIVKIKELIKIDDDLAMLFGLSAGTTPVFLIYALLMKCF